VHVKAVCKSGVLGDSTKASKEKGEKLINLCKDYLRIILASTTFAPFLYTIMGFKSNSLIS